jgi:hypothetical protein
MHQRRIYLSLSKGMLGMGTRKGCAHTENNYGAMTDLQNIPRRSLQRRPWPYKFSTSS